MFEPVVIPIPRKMRFLVLLKNRGASLYQACAHHPSISTISKVRCVSKPDKAVSRLHVPSQISRMVGGLWTSSHVELLLPCSWISMSKGGGVQHESSSSLAL